MERAPELSSDAVPIARRTDRLGSLLLPLVSDSWSASGRAFRAKMEVSHAMTAVDLVLEAMA